MNISLFCSEICHHCTKQLDTSTCNQRLKRYWFESSVPPSISHLSAALIPPVRRGERKQLSHFSPSGRAANKQQTSSRGRQRRFHQPEDILNLSANALVAIHRMIVAAPPPSPFLSCLPNKKKEPFNVRLLHS